MSGIFTTKIIQVRQSFFRSQSKIAGMFLRHTVEGRILFEIWKAAQLLDIHRVSKTSPTFFDCN